MNANQALILKTAAARLNRGELYATMNALTCFGDALTFLVDPVSVRPNSTPEEKEKEVCRHAAYFAIRSLEYSTGESSEDVIECRKLAAEHLG